MTANEPEVSTIDARLGAALSPYYQLLGPLGKGGMGTVFVARDPALRRDVAVKVLSPELASDPEAHARFEREAQAVAALAHPHVVAIYGVGQMADRTPYFVMQLVRGRSLADRVAQDGPLGVPEARRILGEVASALAAAHAKGIIHRDIKPANVLQDDESGRVLVSDFGLVALGRVDAAADAGAPMALGESQDFRLTQSGMRVGTPEYMSPEQLVAEEVTEKTDVYALGLLAYELLLGRGPFNVSSPGELIAAHLRDTPPTLASLRAEVDDELSVLVSSCLAKDAAQRPSAAELERRLLPQGDALLEWPPPSLEWAQGALWRHLGRALRSVTALVVAFGTLVSLGDGLPDLASAGLGLLVIAALLFGAVGLTIRARWLLRDAGRAGRAVAAGYTWRTVLEVAADSDGETGNLIVGVKRFAALTAARRGALRRLRVRAALVALASAFGAPLLLLALAVLGARGLVAADAAVLMAGVPLVAFALALVAPRFVERAQVGKRRRAATSAARVETELAPAWYRAFDAIRGAENDGRGRSGGATYGPAVGVALLVLSLACGVLLAPLGLVVARGATFAGRVMKSYGDGRNVELRLAREEPVLAFAVPVDSTIDPMTAGVSLHTLHTMFQPPQIAGRRDERARVPFTPWPALNAPDAPFQDLRIPVVELPDPGRIFERAVRGFSAEELAWLRRLDAHPAWGAFHDVAVAPHIDELGARFGDAPQPTVHLVGLGPPSGNPLRDLVAANAARAALRLAEGDRAAAERLLREGVGVARSRLSSPRMSEYTLAPAVLATARVALVAYYDATGDAQGIALREALELADVGDDPGLASDRNQRVVEVSYRQLRRDAVAMVRNPRLSVARRVEALGQLGAMQCTSLRDVLLGPDEDLRSAVAFARDSLARFPAERMLFERVLMTPHAVANDRWISVRSRRVLVGKLMAFSGSVLRNDRMRGCAHFLAEY